MITIVDYNAGNPRSIQNMLRSLGYFSTIAKSPNEIADATKLILPGVGHFDFGMKSIRDLGLTEILHEKAINQKTPFLGICLGAQMLTRGSEEGGQPGFGWIAADAIRFDTSRLNESLRVPHIGWADTEYRARSLLFAKTDEIPRYYYAHSYHIKCDDTLDELCHATHGYRFVAGVEKGNIMGVQFHPEKSHRFGKQILSNFAELK